MLQSVLLGPTRGVQQGGLVQFIQYTLHYKPLAWRAFIGLMTCIIAAWLGLAIVAKLGFFVFEIYFSLLIIRFVAGASRLGQIGRILPAMWLPIVVGIAAIYLLFWNDQGRELGVGLMDPGTKRKAALLSVVLIYWALNNWLSARIGLSRVFLKPDKDQHLLFWGPRLVGVGAHLLAAVSLSFAAYSQHDLQTKGLVLIFAAPIAITLAAVFAWLADSAFLSERVDVAARRRALLWTPVVLLAESPSWSSPADPTSCHRASAGRRCSSPGPR